MKVELRTWSAGWAADYGRAAAGIKAMLGDRGVVEHVGSTAIEGLSAKPIIDLLIGFESPAALAEAEAQMVQAGWRGGKPCGDVSAFLKQAAIADVPEVNAHLVVIGDQAWIDLLGFRDWLRVHPQQAEAYGKLKAELAATWSDDLEAYTNHKGSFVCGVLANANSVNVTLRHQRDALGKAVVLRCVSITLQLGIAMSAMLSVLFDSPDTLVILAGFTLLLVIAWLSSDWASRKQLSDGEQARRLIQVEYGLARRVEERSLIMEELSAPHPSLQVASIGANFATRAPPGMRRLAEMIDESAFFSAAVQKRSAVATALFLAGAAVIAFLGFLFFGPRVDDSLLTTTIRMFMAFAVFLLSADVIGAAIAHARAGAVMDRVRLRISAARGRQFPEGDVLQAMSDYNAAVSGAPPPLPFVYELIQAGLVTKWEAHKAAVRIGT